MVIGIFLSLESFTYRLMHGCPLGATGHRCFFTAQEQNVDFTWWFHDNCNCTRISCYYNLTYKNCNYTFSDTLYIRTCITQIIYMYVYAMSINYAVSFAGKLLAMFYIFALCVSMRDLIWFQAFSTCRQHHVYFFMYIIPYNFQ